MEIPFPGMDPYLEQPALWLDVHARLISAMCDAIQEQLGPAYIALITPYIALESIEIAPSRQAFVPDIGVLRDDTPETGRVTTAITPAPLTIPAQMTVPTRYARIEIRAVVQQTLITAIELLSPANKRPGPDGADAYDKKRQELFASSVHLLEIDLLRSGVRPRLARPLPATAYCIFLSRAYRRPLVDVWPIALSDPLPVLPVPLAYPDPDVALDLGAILRQIYRRAHYERLIDYRADPPPPPLTPYEAAWLSAPQGCGEGDFTLFSEHLEACHHHLCTPHIPRYRRGLLSYRKRTPTLQWPVNDCHANATAAPAIGRLLPDHNSICVFMLES